MLGKGKCSETNLKNKMQSEGSHSISCFGCHDHVKILSISYNFHTSNIINFHELTKHPTSQNTFVLIKHHSDKYCESKCYLLSIMDTEKRA